MHGQDLDSLARAHPGCIIAAYADLSSGVTLRIAEATDVPREAVNELCQEAAMTLGAQAAPIGAHPPPLAVKTMKSAYFVFLRAPDDASEAVIALCKHSVDLDSFVADARACFGPPA